MGFRAIERVKGVHQTTVIHWVKQVGPHLPEAYAPHKAPEVGALDALETFVGSKKQKLALDRRRPLYERDFRLGTGKPQCGNLCPLRGAGGPRAMRFLCHKWLERLSRLDGRR